MCPHLTLIFFGRTTIRCRIHIQRFHLETFKTMRWGVCTHTHDPWGNTIKHVIGCIPILLLQTLVCIFSLNISTCSQFSWKAQFSPPPSICTKISCVRFPPAQPFLNCLIPSRDSHLLARTSLGTVNLNTPFSFNEKRNLSCS